MTSLSRERESEGLVGLRYAAELLKITASDFQEECWVPVLNRPGNSWMVPGVISCTRSNLLQALSFPDKWLGLRRCGSVERELETRTRDIPFLDMDRNTKRRFSENLGNVLISVRSGIDEYLKALGIDTSMEYLHWHVDEVMPGLDGLARRALELNEADTYAWQPCTLREQNLFATNRCGPKTINQILAAMQRVDLRLRT